MKEYMSMISNGMEEVKNIGMNTQNEIMRELGINERSLMKYQAQLGPFIQELMMQQHQKNPSQARELTLQ